MSDRPIFRVGVAGLDPRDARLIEILFRHGRRNPHDFRLLDLLDMTAIDILIANASEPEGLDAMAAAREFHRRIPVVVAVPRGAQTAARHSVTIDRLTLQLLPILNRVVQDEGLLEAADPGPTLCNELTELTVIEEAGADGEDVAVAVAPPVLTMAAVVSTPLDAAESPSSALAGRLPALAALEAPAESPVDLAVDASLGQALDPAILDRPLERQVEPSADPGDLPSSDALAAPAAVQPGVSAPDAVSSSGPGPALSPPLDLGDPIPAIEPWSMSPTSVSPAGIASRGERLRVLVVDPSVAAQDQLSGELRRMGLDVVCVVSGAAAARSLATRHVDLIVTETGLADTDGFTLVHWLRRSPAYRETPVILLRSRIGMLDPARAWLDGRMTLLGKPVTRGGLARHVRQSLRHVLVVDDFAA